MNAFTLAEFVTESNRIEGLGAATAREIAAHEELLAERELTVELLASFVASVANAALRRAPGMNVRVGPHQPPPGGPEIVAALTALLRAVNARELSPWAAHQRYETLHPFMDGNGRSGRAVWLWMMGGIEHVPLGFLHTWYYQSLQAARDSVAGA